jgi:hypothetical protein
MPARFGKSRNFFLVAFGGICFLTTSYVLLPALYYSGLWSGGNWVMMIAVWNSLLLLWIATLVWMRGNQSTKRDWFWAWPVSLSLISLNWMAPELFSLGIVYLHPLVALWFLDRQLRRSRPGWVPTYHLFGIFLLLVFALLWQLSGTQSLNDDNGLAWRVTQHAGAELLSGVSTHLLVSLHVFLEMLHYLVWLVALPLLSSTGKIWKLTSIPLVQHPRGLPRLIGTAMALGCLAVALLWLGFSLDYAATRDIYFAVAIAHVLAEAPFLLRTI